MVTRNRCGNRSGRREEGHVRNPNNNAPRRKLTKERDAGLEESLHHATHITAAGQSEITRRRRRPLAADRISHRHAGDSLSRKVTESVRRQPAPAIIDVDRQASAALIDNPA